MEDTPRAVGRQVGRVLKEEGVEYFFGLTGGHIFSFVVGAGRRGIKMVHFRHEQAGGYAADGYARASGKLGVCFGTAGPGMTNQVSAIAQAWSARSPVVAIYAQDETLWDGRQALQEGYAEWALAKYTKWTHRVCNPAAVAYWVKRACRDAMTYPQGPCAVEIPIDISLARLKDSQQVGFIDNSYPAPACPTADSAAVEKAVGILLAAEKPIIAAGDAILWSNAEDELREFVEIAQIPVITRRAGRGSVPEDHPLAFSGRARGKILRAADVACTIGLNLGYLEGYGAWAQNARLIQITESRSDIEFTAKSEQVILGDPKAVLKQMIEAAKELKGKLSPARKAWLAEVDTIKGKERQRLVEQAEAIKNNKPIHPAWVAKVAIDALDKDAIIVLDAFSGSGFFTESFLANHSGAVLDAAGTAGIGHGIPMAIGAKLAKPGYQVLSIMGDGGMGVGGMDIETAVRVGTDVVYVVDNNSDYIAPIGYIFNKSVPVPGRQDLDTPWSTVTTRYDMIGTACGAHGERVEDPAELSGAIERALSAGKAAVVDVVTDNKIGTPLMPPYEAHPRLVSQGMMNFFDPDDFDEPLRSKLYPPKA